MDDLIISLARGSARFDAILGPAQLGQLHFEKSAPSLGGVRTIIITPRLSLAFALGLSLTISPPSASGQSTPPAANPPPQDQNPADESAKEVASFDLEQALLSPDRGFTADEAGTRARARAPQIQSAQAAATSARWDEKVQSDGFLPQLSAYGTYKRVNVVQNSFGAGLDPDRLAPIIAGLQDPNAQVLFGALFAAFGSSSSFTQPPNQYSVGATLRVPVSDMFLRTLPSYKAAGSIADARAIEIETRTASVDLQAREAFYTYARALATQLVAEQALKQAAAQATQAKLFVDAGTAPPVDFMTATARVESMRSALARSRGVVAVTRNTLATLTGVETDEVAPIRERVTVLPEPPAGTIDELLKRAFDQRPELRALRKMVGANDHLKTAERNAALPTLTVDGNTLHGQPNARYIPVNKNSFKNSWEIGATLSWSPNNAVVGYQRTQRASAELQRARADLASFEDGVRIEVVQAYEDYRAADAAAHASEAQQKAAEETYRVRLATYRVGAGVQIDLLAADLALTQARLDYVNAVLDARTSLARLRRAVGTSGS